MIITRENFEKAIRKAKAEGRREAEKEFAVRNNFDCIERNFYDSMNRLENRIIGRLESIEREIGEMRRPTEVLEEKYECSSEPRMPIENLVR